MFKEIFLFEIRTGFKKLATYLYFFIFLALGLLLGLIVAGIFDTASSDSNLIKNSSVAVSQLLVGMSGNIMVLVNGVILISVLSTAIQKDYAYNVHGLLYTKPINKAGYFWGRFLSNYIIAILIFSGLLFGYFVGMLFGIGKPAIGAFKFINFVWPFLIFSIPNVFILGSIFFALTTATRNTLSSYLLCVILLVLSIISQNILSDINNKNLASLIDPFGLFALKQLVEYWTPFEQNTRLIPLSGILLLNRLLWVGIALIFVLITYFSFQFNQFLQPIKWFKIKSKNTEKQEFIEKISLEKLLNVNRSFDFKAKSQQLLYLSVFEFKRIFFTPFFLIILSLIVLLQIVMSQFMKSMYDSSSYPVTYLNMEMAESALGFFLLLLILFFSGNAIWRERETKMDELIGVSTVSNSNLIWSKFLGLTILVLSVLLFSNVISIILQIYQGFYDLKIWLYFTYDLYVLPYYLILIGFCLFIQTMSNNKYLGFFIALIPILFIEIIFSNLEWNDVLYRFNSSGPYMPYSDLNGFGHTLYSYLIIKTYWLAIVLFLFYFGLMFFPRGKEKSLSKRRQLSITSFGTQNRVFLGIFLVVSVALGGFIFYNTHILNKYKTGVDQEKFWVEYEKKFKGLENLPQPRIVSSDLKIAVYPKTRNVNINGFYYLKNKTNQSISKIILRFPFNMNNEILYKTVALENAAQNIKFNPFGISVVALKSDLKPGDSLAFKFQYSIEPRGFQNDEVETEIVKNGSFFNSGFLPGIGYDANAELSENSAREKYHLKPKARMAKVDDLKARENNYISNDADWIRFKAEISTDKDQIAIAPGYLQKEWEKDGRKFYQYQMDSPILNFYAFLSAKYEVKRSKWKNVNLEIYYQKGHEFNLDRMILSMQKSLDYYTKNFSPYQHKQVRIIEFPRYQSFAQSFPNTIPFSEMIGFLTKVDKDDPSKIDVPFYVTAHEVAHQWWAHQVIGGNVQGSVLMSETFSQYSALMVMEHQYGAQAMKKFLSYEMDKYLKGRTNETREEMPLMLCENQNYIHYNKGSVVMYAMKDYLGEDKLNHILSEYLNQVKFQEPPYTNSIEFVTLLKKETPDSLKYLVKDMFETITLYENYVKDLSVKKVHNKYQVKLTVGSAKYRADSKGKSKRIPVSDYIEVGVFGEKSVKDPVGKVLYLKKIKMDQPEKTITLLLDSNPEIAGIDPYNKLIDRNPKNNLHDFKSKPEKVDLSEGTKSGPMGITVQVGD